MARAESNGSFRIKSTGAVEYIGSGGGDNQIVTYNPDTESFEDTDLDELFGGACVSQYVDSAPSERPNGADLEIGDFWTDKNTRILHIWDGDSWDRVLTINGNPVGTIITTVDSRPFAPVPAGYLACTGLPCPPEYNALSSLLLEATGSTDLPNLPGGNWIKY